MLLLVLEVHAVPMLVFVVDVDVVDGLDLEVVLVMLDEVLWLCWTWLMTSSTSSCYCRCIDGGAVRAPAKVLVSDFVLGLALVLVMA